MSGLILVCLMVSGWSDDDGRSADTSQSSEPQRSPFLFDAATGFSTHVFAPPAVLNSGAIAFGGFTCPRAAVRIFASSSRTLLCLHVYLPSVNATLHALSTCSVVCVLLRRGHCGSSLMFHLIRLALDGRRSYTDLRMKLIRRSFHVRVLWMAFSQLVHCPYWLCWTAFWILFWSSSWMTMSLFSFPVVFDDNFISERSRPW